MQSDLHLELQELLGNTYMIERELARGGMSRVFLAVERSLGRRVVIKVLPPELLTGISGARFEREIRVTANLQHPHILPVLATGNSGDLHYYVTPFIEGESLRKRIAKEGALSVDDAVSILQDVADALAHAHERGVVHRDVKPGNVLLSDGRAMLADFGIASALQPAMHGDRLTATGHAIGTPGYMAPEQLVGDPAVDARTDIFALGVLGYEMLAGTAPFNDPTTGGLGLAYFTGPRPLAKARPAVPAAIANAIARAMAPQPHDRFASATEFRDALRPATTSSKSARRRRRLVSVALAALILIATTAGSRTGLTPGIPSNEQDAKVIAVLPFKNLGPQRDAYFADGITEEVTARLATVSGLGVISRTSADQYRDSRKSLREIARELGATYVLEGSVRWERTRNGRGRVRVTPQLIRVRDDSHLWTDRYDEELRGSLDVQARIAEHVARALAAEVAGDE